MCQLLGMDSQFDTLNEDDDILVNWRIYSQNKNSKGRLPLFTALEQQVKWSDGLCTILEGNGGAIEDTDIVTGLEAFMLATVGPNSYIETIFTLLQGHPAALNSYMSITKQKKIRGQKDFF